MNRKTIGVWAILLVFAVSAFAQERRSEVSLQGTGFFTKNTNQSFLAHQATDTGGFLAGYRYHLNRWTAVEANYSYSRNTQQYLAGGGLTAIKSNVHGVSGDFVFNIPVTLAKLRPFALAGAGALVFDPRDNAALPGADSQAKAAFVYGGGLDYDLTRNAALRFGYRGLVYKTPDFGIRSLDLDKVTHTAQPTAGIVFRF